MYEGTNPTALQSQQWITQALLTMMKERPYAAISVKDLCSRADLSRQTFYNLYASKEDILRAYLRAEVAKVYSAMQDAEHPELGDMAKAFMQVLSANRDALGIMIDQGLSPVITDEIAAAVTLFADRFVDRTKKDDDEMIYASAFLSGGLAHTLLQWIREDEPLEEEKLTRILEKILQGNMYSL